MAGYDVYGGAPAKRFRRQHHRDQVPQRAERWIGLSMFIFLSAIALTALGIAIWGVVVATANRRNLNDATDSGLIMRSVPTERGHVPRWDEKEKAWHAGHPKFTELQDVQLGSKRLPLEDGDVLQWRQGQIVNSRERILEQELGHHFDTKFQFLQNGHIIIRNETAGQWRNAPLSALLALGALSDVDMKPHSMTREGPPDQSLFQYDRKRGKWTVRSPVRRGWLRFCVPPESDPVGVWGHFHYPLQADRWVSVRPSTPSIGLHLVNMLMRGGMRGSRKRVSITTPPPDPHAKSSLSLSYRLQATISAINMPPGAWGFLVGSETAPPDHGFRIDTSNGTWTIESLRDIGPSKEIRLAYRVDSADDNDESAGVRGPRAQKRTEPLIQCMRMSVDEA